MKPSSPGPTAVFLTVYDLDPCWNGMCHPIGLGVYKTGVEFSGVEYTYDSEDVVELSEMPRAAPPGGSGVTWHAPIHEDANPPCRLRARIPLGRVEMHSEEVHDQLQELAQQWAAADYHALEQNCNHWTHAAGRTLGLPTPNWPDGFVRVLRVCTGAACITHAARVEEEERRLTDTPSLNRPSRRAALKLTRV